MKRFIKSVACALDGIRAAFKSELHFRIHLAAMCLAIAMGFYLELSPTGWGFVIMSIGCVLSAELFNTSVERLGDQAANGDYKLLVKHAKDTAAGAVVVSIVTALIIGVLFLLVPLARKIFG